MKRMTSPSDSSTSLRTAFRRSSNSPRYLAPAMRAPRSRAITRLFLSASGTSPFDDPLGEPLDDGGLADARLADEDRVVLGAAGEDLDDAADLLVAADHRVELALARELCQVAAVLLEGLVAVLGVRVVHALVAADVLQRLEERVAGGARALQRLGGRRPAVEKRQQQVLGGDVLVLEGFRLTERLLQGGVELRRSVRGRAVGPRQRGEALLDVGREAARVHPDLAEGRGDDATLLVEERLHEVFGRHLRVVALLRQGLGSRQGLLALHRELIETHGCQSPPLPQDR